MKNSGATLARGLKMLIFDFKNVVSYIDDDCLYRRLKYSHSSAGWTDESTPAGESDRSSD